MEECIFCKIAKGEIPSQMVYEDEKIIAFKDIHPATPIHILIIPRKHIENVLELEKEDRELMADIFEVIQKLAKQLNVEKDGFRIINNCGRDSGQEVMHIHFHLLAGQKMGDKIV